MALVFLHILHITPSQLCTGEYKYITTCDFNKQILFFLLICTFCLFCELWTNKRIRIHLFYQKSYRTRPRPGWLGPYDHTDCRSFVKDPSIYNLSSDPLKIFSDAERTVWLSRLSHNYSFTKEMLSKVKSCSFLRTIKLDCSKIEIDHGMTQLLTKSLMVNLC